MVFTTCPSCNNELEIESKYLGKGVMCPYCQKLFVPPLPNATLGIAALSLAGLAVLIELFVLVYFLTGASWHTGFLSVKRVQMLMYLIRFLGLIISWTGIGCAIFAMLRRRRRKNAAKWALLINVALTLFVCGYFMLEDRLPNRSPAVEQEESPDQ